MKALAWKGPYGWKEVYMVYQEYLKVIVIAYLSTYLKRFISAEFTDKYLKITNSVHYI